MGKNSFSLPPFRDPDSVTPDEKARLSLYHAPAGSGGNGNDDLIDSANLADILDELPLLSGVQLRALIGGGGPDAGAWNSPLTVAELIDLGAQPGENYFLHFNFPKAPGVSTYNAAGLLRNFQSIGWEAGITRLLNEMGFPNANAITALAQAPEVAAKVREIGDQAFAAFPPPPPPPFDPFAQPVGLHPSQGGR